MEAPKRKKNYRTRKTESESERLSFRVGSKLVSDLDDFARRKDMMKVKILRDALNYWISVDGKAKDLEKTVAELRTELRYKNKILSERRLFLEEVRELFEGYKKE